MVIRFLISLLIAVTVSGCKAKIAGDEYLIGPFPISSEQDEDRNRNRQEPAPDEKGSDPEDRPKEENK